VRAKTLRASVLISRRSPRCNRGDRRKATFAIKTDAKFILLIFSSLTIATAIIIIDRQEILDYRRCGNQNCFTGNVLYKSPIVRDMTSRGTIGEVVGQENSFSYSTRDSNRSSELVTTAMLSNQAGHTSYSYGSSNQNCFTQLIG
jgi:hypothetical protein